MNYKDKKFLEKVLKHKRRLIKNNSYPLTLENPLDVDDIIKGIEVLLDGQVTMSTITKKFEKEFAKFVGSKYALMVNSGSSANLLAFFSLTNPMQLNKVRYGSECIIPGLCWSTSLWPIVQSNLIPKFVDIKIDTFNIDIKDLVKNISKKQKLLWQFIF